MLKRRWSIAPPVPSAFQARFADFPALIAQIFFNRGITSLQDARTFLGDGAGGDETTGGNPFLMCGMSHAVERLSRAICDGEMIAVYGDFDADGVCSTALLTQTLKSLGAKAIPYIPHRINEGYGLNADALRDLKEKGARIVVTVDCGIRSLREVDEGTALGLDMIVTDHHSVGTQLPNAVAVINPKQPGDPYPFKDLAGVGVAFKLTQALLDQVNKLPVGVQPVQLDDLYDLVALGTVADLVPLTGENRNLVKRGIKRLVISERPGLQALLRQAGARGRKIDAGTIGYFLGPRLNAAGRIEHARTAYKLLVTQYPGEGDELAARLEATNRERQKVTDEMVTRAREMIAAQPPGELLLIAGSSDFPEGIIGLIASKLQEEAYRPAIAISHDPEKKRMRGSARSIPEFNIVAALDECADLLVRHGGHAAAAGFTVENDNFDALYARLRAIAVRELGALELTPTLSVDAEASLGEMSWQLLEHLDKFAPYGYGNREPLFLTRGALVRSARIVGTDHLALTLTDGTLVWDAIAFRQKDLYSQLVDLPKPIDLVYCLASKTWQGEPRLQLEVKDLRPSEDA